MMPAGEDAYLGLLRKNHICMHVTVTFRRQALESIGGYDVWPQHAKITTST